MHYFESHGDNQSLILNRVKCNSNIMIMPEMMSGNAELLKKTFYYMIIKFFHRDAALIDWKMVIRFCATRMGMEAGTGRLKYKKCPQKYSLVEVFSLFHWTRSTALYVGTFKLNNFLLLIFSNAIVMEQKQLCWLGMLM